MASVRLTVELQDAIINSVNDDFVEVKRGFKFSKENDTEVTEFAQAMLSQGVVEQESTIANILAAVLPIAEASGYNKSGDNIGDLADLHGLVDSLTTQVYEYQSFYVRTVDPEDENGRVIDIYQSGYPFDGIHKTRRTVLNWHPLANHKTSATSDQGLVDKLLPLFLKQRAMDESRRLAIDYAKGMMSGCNTLAQLVRKWPDAINVVPERFINRMNDKTTKAMPAAQPEPESLMNMDDALKSIRLQAEAVKLLR